MAVRDIHAQPVRGRDARQQHEREQNAVLLATFIPGAPPGLWVGELARLTRLSIRTTAKALDEMRRRGRVVRYRKKGVWLYHYRGAQP